MISKEHYRIIQIKKVMESKVSLLMLFHIEIFVNGILVHGIRLFYATQNTLA